MIQQNERVRAWVLIQDGSYPTIAEQIHKLDTGHDELVVIRVDQVDENETPKIMAVIDADYEYFPKVQGYINDIVGTGNATYFVVTAHNPDPPNDASGYIANSERIQSEIKLPHAGRQDNSPGFNPWG